MALPSGTRLGPYEVLGRLGAGGMGEVYRARDTKLDRQVALKVLPDQWAGDPDRLARFDREARALAALNHPNIAAIYGREPAGDVEALVLELVEGPTLEDVIKAGPVPVDDALKIARQVALALEAAHGQGILHRDLKPANLKVRPDGTVKVLDFGLAKVGDPGANGAVPHGSAATVTSPMTALGMILGTAAYMAPEQAKGKPVDARADVWAFGCVLFEMLTGRRAFEGEDVTETLAAIVRGEPDWAALPAATPRRVRRLLRRCLRKDPVERLHDVGDARLELDDASDDEATDAGVGQAGPRRAGITRERVAWLLAGAATAAAAWLAFSTPDRVGPANEAMSFELGELETSPLFTQPTDFALSPDGQHIAFTATAPGSTSRTIWIRSLASTTPRSLAGTEGGVAPFWSPDSRSVAFGARGQLRKIAIENGLPQTIAPGNATAGGTWSPNGTIVFTSDRHLYRVSASGGAAEQISTDEELKEHGIHRWPAFLPDGRHFVTVRSNSEDAVLSSLGSTERRRLFATSSKVVPSSAGYLLFVRDTTLLAQPFDLQARTDTGEAVPVAQNLTTISFTGNMRGGAADFTVSGTGMLFHRAGGDPESQMAWFDRAGKRLSILPGQPAGYSGAALSPDGRHITFHIHTSEGGDIQVMELARGAVSRITFKDGQHAAAPFWIGNERVGFSAINGERTDLYHTRVPATDRQQTLIAEDASSNASSDGVHVAFRKAGSLWIARLGATDAPVDLGPGSYPDFSPDGRWLSYQSDVSGRTEIHVRPVSGAGDPLRISTDGGMKPRWGQSGRELFYLTQAGELMAVSVGLTTTPATIGRPAMLFKPDFRCFTCAFVPYDVGADDQQFLIIANVQEGRRIQPATLVLDWAKRIKR